MKDKQLCGFCKKHPMVDVVMLERNHLAMPVCKRCRRIYDFLDFMRDKYQTEVSVELLDDWYKPKSNRKPLDSEILPIQADL